MSWRYQIIRKKSKYGFHFDLHEVYVNKKGKPHSWTSRPISIAGFESADDLIKNFSYMMADAHHYPVCEIKKGKIVEVKS